MSGIESAGKTTIFFELKLSEMVTTIAEIGFHVETVEYKNYFFIVWAVRGLDKFRPLWHHAARMRTV